MARSDILEFLRDPVAFSAVSAKPDLWKAALDAVALPKIAAASASGGRVRKLQDAQLAAWERLIDQRVGLILGPPGTGKTFTLSWMALAYLLAHQQAGLPCRVMITAFTRGAAINVLEAVAATSSEVLGVQLPIWFLGETPDGGEKSGVEYLKAKDFKLALEQPYSVVGCTTWGLYRALNDGAHGAARGSRDADLFDLVCIDEASQLPVTQGLMALAGLKSDGRVLVAGDNRQLAPIGGGYDWDVDERSLGGSLYDFLVKAKIQEQRLTETFRLNEPLSNFPARQFYDGAYFSAAAVKEQRLRLNVGWEQGLEPWQRVALSPEYPVVVLLYDGPAAGTRNQNEAELVRQLVDALWHRVAPTGEAPIVTPTDFWSKQLAVVSPHRAQNVAIREALARYAHAQSAVVETVEKIQGRERDAIIASYTVADPEFALVEAGFLFSPQRFNVSLTRARSKFVLIMSRALLEVVPPDDELFDAARLLREFVFECAEAGNVDLTPRPGQLLKVTVRVRGFDATTPLPTDLMAPAADLVMETMAPPAMTRPLQDVLAAIRIESSKTVASSDGRYKSVAIWDLTTHLGREVSFGELRALQLNGHILLRQQSKKDGVTWFWKVEPLDPPRLPVACTPASVRTQLQRVVLELKSKWWPRCDAVRDFFAWVDEEELDTFRPIIEQMQRDGTLRLEFDKFQNERIRLEESELEQTPPPPPSEALSDEDFVLLNALEDLEARRINFGIFEAWSTAASVAKHTGRLSNDVAESFRKLEAHGHLMRTSDEVPKVRSRMGELARELRYVKQRFRTDDAKDRPFLVRSLKVIARTRNKPVRDRSVVAILGELSTSMRELPHAPAVLAALQAVLCARWHSASPTITGFQERAWRALLPAYFGLEQVHSAVITADTGAGKTEAACIPLIVGAAVDALNGIRGTRAVLVYPRVRLAANQAQRLTAYLGELSRQEHMPCLTIGLQTGDVPRDWRTALREHEEAKNGSSDDKPPVWVSISHGRWRFPFFTCPNLDCGSPLTLVETESPLDRLVCDHTTGCGWTFDGWIGTKDGLKRHPPHIFLPVTESLHQWMQQSQYGGIFGDGSRTPSGNAAPRVVLADEIHLYSLVPGAQVGYALRRLMARMRANGTANPLVIGMSATLGDPTKVWSDLIGRPANLVLHVGPHEDERTENVRGREYFYFVQPEVESRGHDIAGASTTIQSLMCLAHGMRRRTGDEGGYRSIVFLDSIDKLKRLHGDYQDAEENTRLARLRTTHKGDASSCSPTGDQCGEDPRSCDRFRDGECWYFAANDKAQWTARGLYEPGRNLSVCRTPIFSKTKGNADEIVQQSDIVFSTSSLEVGFDDPDMTLVYQHYAPLNLASFVQRKGRGGRGVDDRPITGVTLSVYSPRDTWYFRSPERMLNVSDVEIPLNVDNFFVRRGQVLSLILDWAARREAQGGRLPDPNTGLGEVLREVDPVVREVFGARIYEDLEVDGLDQLWRKSVRESTSQAVPPRLSGHSPRDWAKQLLQVPNPLFSPINLPLLAVRYTNDQNQPKEEREDVTLAFSECTPGRATRRFGYQTVHWTPYRGPSAPLLDLSNQKMFRTFDIAPGPSVGSDVRRFLPIDAREIVGGRPVGAYVRPLALQMETLGELRGREWYGQWEFDPMLRVVQLRGPDSKAPIVNHKSTGRLLGTVIAIPEPERALRLPVPALNELTAGTLTSYKCHRSKGRGTGLRVTHAFWASDIALVLDIKHGGQQKRETEYLRQVFSSSKEPTWPGLFGYGMESEGICLDIDSARLDTFVAAEFANSPASSSEGAWLRSQHFRYLIASGCSGVGINSFQARHLADLLVAGYAVLSVKEKLERRLKMWSWSRLAEDLQDVYAELLNQSPVLTEARVEKTLKDIEKSGVNLHLVLKRASADSCDDDKFKLWLRTAVLHGLVIRLKQLFILHGRGDEHKVLLHVALPVQFGGDAHDRLTVCEKGGFGDGTTRTFLARADEAFETWRTEGVVACPNARADEAMAAAFANVTRHDEWRSWDPADPKKLQQIGQELGLQPDADSGALQLIGRLLFGAEEVFGERFTYYDLYREIVEIQDGLADPAGDTQMTREPGTWELVSAVVHAASGRNPEVPHWTRLLEVYRGIEDASSEESLGPEARLADQVFRISARLCPDGCQACLHLGSDVMDDDLATMTVSRRVLERFWLHVQEQPVADVVVRMPEMDPAMFSSDWAYPFTELVQIHQVAVEPGRDVAGADGRVVGTTTARVRRGGLDLHLIDQRAPWAVATAAALKDLGEQTVSCAPASGVDPILDALEA